MFLPSDFPQNIHIKVEFFTKKIIDRSFKILLKFTFTTTNCFEIFFKFFCDLRFKKKINILKTNLNLNVTNYYKIIVFLHIKNSRQTISQIWKLNAKIIWWLWQSTFCICEWKFQQNWSRKWPLYKDIEKTSKHVGKNRRW